MIVEEMKARVTKAVKEGNALERDIIRFALSEIQAIQNREGAMDEERALGIIRKIIANNSEVVGKAPPEAAAKMRQENAVLETLLPKTLNAAAIEEALRKDATLLDQIKQARNDGQATGVAMKFLKSANLTVLGKDVSLAVANIRKA